MDAEKKRLQEDFEKKAHWRKWGPYLSERQWGTVREDYSEDGQAWSYSTYDSARFKAYRWGEDGIAGISDNHQRLCFAWAFWNEQDSFLKERLFGLSGPQGNHGEDVKEIYYYLDNLPSHAYMKYLYRYPQKPFPYKELIEENSRRKLSELEYEIVDTHIFDTDQFFDIFIEYAKIDPEQMAIKLTVINQSKQPAPLHILPTIWFRNSWDYGKERYKPGLQAEFNKIRILHKDLKERLLYFPHHENGELLFTENSTNFEKLNGGVNLTTHVKDAFHEYIVHGKKQAVNPKQIGTKAAIHYRFLFKPGETKELLFLLTDKESENSEESLKELFQLRQEEADLFYRQFGSSFISEEKAQIQRQAFAGLLWNKQFYHFAVEDWLSEKTRKNIRNGQWLHLYNDDILSVPDKWEYPCFFSWDTAFHCIAYALIDPEFAKKQLILLTREWYMHPNGQLPASEWDFNDVNPPVHAWAIWRVYKIEQKMTGQKDVQFLERVFQKLLLNFTWWVNRKDALGKNIFEGGFLGLDNISVFNRSQKMPSGWSLYQSDATSWMGMYCLNMLTIALELAGYNPVYEDMASKFFEHFLYIAEAINHPGSGLTLWHEEEGFFYDFLYSESQFIPLKVKSLVGLIPLFAVMTAEYNRIEKFPDFKRRLEWFLKHRVDLCSKLGQAITTPGQENRRLLAIVNKERLKKLIEKMVDEEEFLSPYGIRSLSKYHEKNPFVLKLPYEEAMIDYEPAESTSRMFGGNSNWRGPIWFPLNFLIIESLQKFHHYYGDSFKVEFPARSGNYLNLNQIATEISKRLLSIFEKDQNGNRPLFGNKEIFNKHPSFEPHLFFYEYFHGDNGAGIGANHQTGWTALVAKLIQQVSECN